MHGQHKHQTRVEVSSSFDNLPTFRTPSVSLARSPHTSNEIIEHGGSLRPLGYVCVVLLSLLGVGAVIFLFIAPLLVRRSDPSQHPLLLQSVIWSTGEPEEDTAGLTSSTSPASLSWSVNTTESYSDEYEDFDDEVTALAGTHSVAGTSKTKIVRNKWNAQRAHGIAKGSTMHTRNVHSTWNRILSEAFLKATERSPSSDGVRTSFRTETLHVSSLLLFAAKVHLSLIGSATSNGVIDGSVPAGKYDIHSTGGNETQGISLLVSNASAKDVTRNAFETTSDRSRGSILAAGRGTDTEVVSATISGGLLTTTAIGTVNVDRSELRVRASQVIPKSTRQYGSTRTLPPKYLGRKFSPVSQGFPKRSKPMNDPSEVVNFSPEEYNRVYSAARKESSGRVLPAMSTEKMTNKVIKLNKGYINGNTEGDDPEHVPPTEIDTTIKPRLPPEIPGFKTLSPDSSRDIATSASTKQNESVSIDIGGRSSYARNVSIESS